MLGFLSGRVVARDGNGEVAILEVLVRRRSRKRREQNLENEGMLNLHGTSYISPRVRACLRKVKLLAKRCALIEEKES